MSDAENYFQLSSRTFNWNDSLDVYNYYKGLIRCELNRLGITDHSKFDFHLKNLDPVFTQWDYTETPEPNTERLQLLRQNYYEFEINTNVDVEQDIVNYTLIRSIRIPSRHNKYFLRNNFLPPTVSIRVDGPRTPEIINLIVRVIPFTVEKVNTNWVLPYIASSSACRRIYVTFKMRYVYFTQETDVIRSASSTRSDIQVFDADVEDTLVQALPPTIEEPIVRRTVEQTMHSSAQLEQSSQPSKIEETEQIKDEEIIVPVRREGSLRSSIEKRKLTPCVDLIKEVLDIPSTSSNTYYALNKNTHSQLSKVNKK